MCLQKPQIERKRPMGVTVFDRHFPGPAEVPEELLQGPCVALDVAAIDAHIRLWQGKIGDSRQSARERYLAEGMVSALQTVRVVHGLPLLEVGP